MRRALFYFVQVAILVALAVWLSDHPGKVEINWLGYRIETYFGILVLLVGVLLLVITAVYRTWRTVLGAPGEYLAYRRTRRREEGYRSLALGLAAAAAGDRDEAKTLARRADALLQDPDLTRLLSAQAASLNGDEAAALRYFNALSENDETAFVGLTGLIRQAIQVGDTPRVLELAERAHRIRPDSAFVVETLFDLQTRGARWQEAQATLFDAVRRDVKPESAAIGHRKAIFTARAREAEQAGQFDDAADLAEKALAGTGDFVPAAVLRARLAARDGKTRKTIRLLEDLWASNPHPELVAAYTGLWPNETPLERLRRVQKLTRSNTGALESRLALAAAALDAELWGEARRNLNGLADQALSVRACRLMARLEQDEHGDSAAARLWLERTGAAPPDQSWTCGSCGAVAPDWSALCGNCGVFDTISWKQPPRVSILPLSPVDDGVLEEASAPEPGMALIEAEPASKADPSLERRAS